MKIKIIGLRHCSVVLITTLLISTVSTVNAQPNYSIEWSTIDGGGGTSTGGICPHSEQHSTRNKPD